MIFVDTGPFVARCIRRDQYHEQATKAWERLARDGSAIVSSSFVLDELLTLVGRKTNHRFAARQGKTLLASRELDLIRPDESDEVRALELFVDYGDQGVSFTDCISFALMHRLGVKRAFTFDAHFATAGFEVWPGVD